MRLWKLVRICLLLLLISDVSFGDLQFENYKIYSDSLPEDVRFRPPTGNGYLATNVLSDTVYMNGLYNGREDESSRARIPAYVSADVNVTGEKVKFTRYMLDMFNGLFTKTVRTDKLRIDIQTFAYRKDTRLLVSIFRLTRVGNSTGDLTAHLYTHRGDDSSDFIWEKEQLQHGYQRETIYHRGTIKLMELPDLPPSVLHVFYTAVPSTLVLPDGQKSNQVSFLASHSLSEVDARKSYVAGLEQAQDTKSLLNTHTQSWGSLWEFGRIDVHDNKELSQNVAAATYNILCSLPDKDDTDTPFYGLSPGGLSRGGRINPERAGGPTNDYAGHVFWDMDTWVMPSVMLFHPSMALRMLRSRIRVLDQAKRNADMVGRDGAKYPWEQAVTGIEATPKWAGNTSLFQIHVTADIAYALRQYLYATNDEGVLQKGRGFELAVETARFWKSRVTPGGNGRLEILKVMGPDEYHFNINNSVYTNYNAKLNLLLPKYILDNFNISVNDSLQTEIEALATIANNIYIPFNKERKFHPQYDGFDFTAKIKQSDVVLLGYPLMMPLPPEVRKNDLELYENITDPGGPDTGTWSMHTVGWLELGEEEKAYDSFKMMFRNINEPFKVFSERPVSNTSNGGCVNFITGAGGFLQSVIFGYGGLRIREDRLDINPTLLPNTTEWHIVGIHYKGTTLDLAITRDKMQLELTWIRTGLNIFVSTNGTDTHRLLYHKSHNMTRGHASIRVEARKPLSSTASVTTTVSLTTKTKISGQTSASAHPFHNRIVFFHSKPVSVLCFFMAPLILFLSLAENTLQFTCI